MKNQDKIFSLYLEHGITAIPTMVTQGDRKRPLVPWTPYMKAHATFEEAALWDSWFAEGKCGIALPCGKNNGIVALDFDTDEFVNHPIVPKSACSKFGARGITLLFEHSGEAATNIKCKGGRPGVEVRSDGNIIVIPPTIHENGNIYRWVGCDLLEALSSGLLNPLPADFIKEFCELVGHRTEQQNTRDFGHLNIAIEQVPEMLKFIPYGYWVEVCMGLSYEFGEAAWKAFDDWSRADPTPGKYNAKENRSRWDSFKHQKTKNITMGSVIGYAVDAGFRIPEFETMVVNGGAPMPERQIVAEAEPEVLYDKDEFPVMPLPQEFVDTAPGIFGKVIKDMFRIAPTDNIHMCLAGALALMGMLKSHRVKMRSGLRPALLVIGVSGPSAGKESPGKYIRKILDLLKEGGVKGLTQWWFDKPGSAEGLQEALANRARIMTWDEIGKEFVGALKNPGGHQAGIITAITKISTKSDSAMKTNALANRDQSTPMKLIKNPHLNLYGSTVHEHIFEAIGLEGFGGGTWARILFVWGTTIMHTRLHIEEDVPDPNLVAEIQAWIDANPEQVVDTDPIRTVDLSEEDNLRVFNRQNQLMEESRKKDLIIREIFGRYRERVGQVALAIEDGHLGDNGWEIKTIDSDTVTWAMAFVEFSFRTLVENALPGRLANSLAQKVANQIVLFLKDGPKTELAVHTHVNEHGVKVMDDQLVEKCISWLVEQRVIIRGKVKGKSGRGRPHRVLKIPTKEELDKLDH